MTDTEVLFEERGSIGLITLNRPKALNSLTHGMCVTVFEQLEKWRLTPAVKAVVVIGSGEKAFCAGGDVVKVSKSWQAGTGEWRDFFHDEYQMNMAIDAFPKPYISLADGIVMGGGVGISIPGDFWVATEKTLFAMPETGLGLFPDVGGGWFLPRLPGETGMYMALTGARAKAADLYALGIASHVTDSATVPAIVNALARADIDSNADVQDILDGFHSDPEPAPLSPHFDDIDDHFDFANVGGIIASLQADESEWAQKQASILAKKSPTSLKLTYAQLKCGAAVESFPENMAMEYRLVNRMVAHPDFHEGVRAILLDKDNAPKWSPAELGKITDSEIEAYFESLGRDDLEIERA